MKRIEFQLLLLTMILVGCNETVTKPGFFYYDYYSKLYEQKDSETIDSVALFYNKENIDTIISDWQPKYYYDFPINFEYPDKNFIWADSLFWQGKYHPYYFLDYWKSNFSLLDSAYLKTPYLPDRYLNKSSLKE